MRWENSIVGLSPGQRLLLEADSKAYRLVSGRYELYVLRTSSKQSIYVGEIGVEESVFPLPEGELVFQLYCLEAGECSIWQEDAYDFAALKAAMKRWTACCGQGAYTQLNTWLDGELLEQWPDAALFDKAADKEELWRQCQNYQGELRNIFLRCFQTNGELKRGQIEKREKKQQQLINDSINNLLQDNQQDGIFASDHAGENASVEEYTFLVRRVAESLHMPAERIKLDVRIAQRLDQTGLLKRLMQKGNMNLRLVSLDEGWYKADCGTLLGYYGAEKELVALLPDSAESYIMVSAAKPQGTRVDVDIARLIDKDGFQCYAGFPARRLSVKDVLAFMFKHCWRRDYYTIIICSLIAGIIPIAAPIITENIFSDIIPINDHQSLAAVTQIMLLTGFTTAALGLVRSIAVIRITNHLDMNVEAAMWGRLLQLPVRFFRRFETGELLQRMEGIESIKQFVTGEFVGQVFNFVFSFWSLFLMLYYSAKLTLEALAIWLIYFVVVAFIYRRIIGFQKEMVAAANMTAGLVQQIFSGLAKFRVHGGEAQAYNLWTKVFGREWKWLMKLRWQGNYNGIIASIQPFILSMLLYYTAVYGMSEVNALGQTVKNMSYAEFMAFQAAFSAFNGTMVAIVPLVAQLFTMKPYVDNLKPILAEEPEVTDDKLDSELLTGMIKVEHLSFSYGPDMPDVLQDINFQINPGENVAIVGRSGCGKSTLLRLLLGMEAPKKGAIYYDYQDLQELSLASVRCQLGVVLQTGQLMTGTIYENIVGTSPLSVDDAWEAAAKAGIAADIRAMPMDMHTIISEDSGNISGGQKQRILIARAIAAKPAIIILDEATSALDNKSQAIVTDSLSRMHSTRIVVAHRLSTIRNADRILVIDKGRLAEQGTFDELLAKGGLFARLAERQMV